MMSSAPSSQSSSDKACYFVTGGSADVGCGLVATLLEKGHCVATVTRQADTAKELRQRHASSGDCFLVVEGDLSTEEGTRKVWKEVSGRFPEIKHVVASVGGWEEMLKQNKVIENDVSDLQTAFETFAVPQFNLAKVILPEIGERKDSSYTIITGAAPCCFMGTGWGPVAVGIGAVHGLSTALRGECKDCQVRINEVRLGLRVLQEQQVSDSSKVSTYDLGKALAAISCCSDLKGEVVTFDTRDEVQECLKGDKSMFERAKEKMSDTKQQGQQLLERAKEKLSTSSSSGQGSEYQGQGQFHAQFQGQQQQQPYQGQSFQSQQQPYKQEQQGHEKGLLERAKEKLLGTSEQHSGSSQQYQQQPYSQQQGTESEKLQERMRTQQQQPSGISAGISAGINAGHQPSSSSQPSSTGISAGISAGASHQPSSSSSSSSHQPSSSYQPSSSSSSSSHQPSSSSSSSSHQPSSSISSGLGSSSSSSYQPSSSSSHQPSSSISSGFGSSSQQPSSGISSSSRNAPYTETEKIERVRIHPGGAPQQERESESQERNRMLSEGGGQRNQEQQERERERGTGSEREKTKEKDKDRNRERSSTSSSNRPLA